MDVVDLTDVVQAKDEINVPIAFSASGCYIFIDPTDPAQKWMCKSDRHCLEVDVADLTHVVLKWML